MAIPTISVKQNGQWVPLNSLPAQVQSDIRKRAAMVLRQSLERQIALLAGTSK